MLRKVEIKNFRGFESFELKFRERTLLIGPNNAGKTTLVSALRLIAHLVRPGHPRRFEDVGTRSGCVRLDLEALDIPTRTLTHNYASGPVIIKAHFDDNLVLTIQLSDDEPSFGSWSLGGLDLVRPDIVRNALTGTTIGAVPPVGPLEAEEGVLTEAYLKRQVDGRLSSRHFRNQWRVAAALELDFASFEELVEETLPGLQVFESQIQMLPDKTILAMSFREGPFVGT